MFQVGDRVVRDVEWQDINDWEIACKKAGISVGEILEVSHTGTSTVSFKGVISRWDLDRFKLVESVAPKTTTDAVRSPSHYQFFPGTEAIEIIAASLTKAEFKGYCMGNRLKYRLRAGNKDKLEQDIQKSDFYLELYSRHVDKCKAD